MARTTPAQKPRGWANITFIKTSRFGTGFALFRNLRLTLRPAAARRAGLACLGVSMSRGVGGVALLPLFFQFFISIDPQRSAAPPRGQYHEWIKTPRRNDHLC